MNQPIPSSFSDPESCSSSLRKDTPQDNEALKPAPRMNLNKRGSEGPKKVPNLKLRSQGEDMPSPISEKLNGTIVNKMVQNSKPSDIAANIMSSSKDLTIPSKAMESPFTMFCKGLDLSPAFHNYASPYNFGSFPFRASNDLIHYASPSPIPLRPLHEMDANYQTKKHIAKLNFDNCLFMFNNGQQDDLPETEPVTKAQEDMRTKSPFFNNFSPQFDFMKKSIYTFSNFPAQNNNTNKAHDHTMHPQVPQDTSSLTLPPLNAQTYQDLAVGKNLSSSSLNNQSVHENSVASFSQNYQTPHEENTLAVKPSFSSDKLDSGLSSKVTHDGSQKGADESGPVKVCCKCKKSRCLKLYCDCFARGEYCKGDCVCVQCLNTKESEKERQNAISAILDKNPNAFKPKVDVADQDEVHDKLKGRHMTGCNCKKSGCMKKYCECYQAGVECSELCKCENCKNTTHTSCIKKAKKLGIFGFNGEENSAKNVSSPRGHTTSQRSTDGKKKKADSDATNFTEVAEHIYEEDDDDDEEEYSYPTKKLVIEKGDLSKSSKTLGDTYGDSETGVRSSRRKNSSQKQDSDGEYLPRYSSQEKSNKRRTVY